MKRTMMAVVVLMGQACSVWMDSGEEVQEVAELAASIVQEEGVLEQAKEAATAALEVGQAVAETVSSVEADLGEFRPAVVAACRKLDACDCQPYVACVAEAKAALTVASGARAIIGKQLSHDEMSTEILGLFDEVGQATIISEMTAVAAASCEELACDEESIARLEAELVAEWEALQQAEAAQAAQQAAQARAMQNPAGVAPGYVGYMGGQLPVQAATQAGDPAVGLGMVQVILDSYSLELLVDGERVEGESPIVVRLPEGQHVVAARSISGKVRDTKIVDVTAGKVTLVTLE